MILCNSRPVTNTVDKLQLVLRINWILLVIITKYWDFKTETGDIKGYLNFFNNSRNRQYTRRGGGVGIYCRENLVKAFTLPCRKVTNFSDSCYEIIWFGASREVYQKPILPITNVN
ncbi:hypothetical protein QYM36_008767 [Artemia franciscana]|uniref:Uncharacterized protein n=1 Tax=Artemia franciscana TaxID=6661 RepID=A0AA88L0D9_ARTSF|nr:hypothetical protein QYM36_008767 [Artemia franciscana]